MWDHVHRNVYRHADICTDMHAHMCIDKGTDMRTDTYIDVSPNVEPSVETSSLLSPSSHMSARPAWMAMRIHV